MSFGMPFGQCISWDDSFAGEGSATAKPLLSGAQWEIVMPLLSAPKRSSFRYHARKPVDDCQAQTSFLYELKTIISWEDLPVEMNCGCDMYSWNRLPHSQRACVCTQVHQVLLTRLKNAQLIHILLASVGSAVAHAFAGVEGSGKNPTDRGRTGVKHHVLVDGQGVADGRIILANWLEIMKLLPLLDQSGPQDAKAQSQRHPENENGERGYDFESHREELCSGGITPSLAERNTEHDRGLAVFR